MILIKLRTKKKAKNIKLTSSCRKIPIFSKYRHFLKCIKVLEWESIPWEMTPKTKARRKRYQFIQKDISIKILNSFLIQFLDLHAIILIKKFLMLKHRGLITIFGLINTKNKLKKVGKEVLNKQILEHTDPYQQTLLIEPNWIMKKGKRNWARKNLIMVLAHLILSSLTLEQKRAWVKLDQTLATTIQWLSGKAKVQMQRRTTGYGAYQQAQVAVYIIDVNKW